MSAFTLLLKNCKQLNCLFSKYSKYQSTIYNGREISRDIKEICMPFRLEKDQITTIKWFLYRQLILGLNPETRNKVSVKCYVTYVQDFPTGKEKGKYLALDLGGTNLRVLLVKLDGHGDIKVDSQLFKISNDIMTGSGEQLFKFISDCLYNFTKNYNLNREGLPLGFTFSFPVEQQGLTAGILQKWTKGFSCDDVEGYDVVSLLQNAIKPNDDLKLSVHAILNDTTGTLMSAAWKYSRCKAGIILGTGSNACYVEQIKNIPNFNGDHRKAKVIINTEWGAFGDNDELNFIWTLFDEYLDKDSINPGKQKFEKMMSGMYLGELVRLIITKLIDEKLLFLNKNTNKFTNKFSFLTEYISKIESVEFNDFEICRNILKEMEMDEVTDYECACVRYVCESVSVRSSMLASAGIAALLTKINEKNVVIGIDGSLYRHHPHFHNRMDFLILKNIDPSLRGFKLVLSHDGSGIGAAIVAASAYNSKLLETHRHAT